MAGKQPATPNSRSTLLIMTLQQLVTDLSRHLPHDANSKVFISVPDRVGRYQADWTHVTIKGVEIVASEPASSTNRTAIKR